MIKSIIWDFDGTLFDTYPSMVYAFKEALKEIGAYESEEEILKYLKVSLKNAMEHFGKLYPIGNNFSERFHYYDNIYPVEKVKPFYPLLEVLNTLKDMEVNNFILTHRDESVYKYLKFHNVINFFDHICSKEMNFKRKPDPEGFLYFVNKYSLEKEEVLAVGDREIDILGGKNAGIKTCFYNTNNVVLSVEPDYRVKSLSDVVKIL